MMADRVVTSHELSNLKLANLSTLLFGAERPDRDVALRSRCDQIEKLLLPPILPISFLVADNTRLMIILRLIQLYRIETS